MKKGYILFVFALFCLFSTFKVTNAAVIFNQTPYDYNGQFLTGSILNSGYLTSFTCTAGLECGVSGQTIYNIGVWIKKVGNPDDVLIQVGGSYNDENLGTTTASNVVSSSSVSDTDYTLKWFHFPQGVVIGNRYAYDQFFFFKFATSTPSYDGINYYSVRKSSVNDYSAQQQWCRKYEGCYSSAFFWQMDDSNIDLSTTTPPACVLNCSSSVMFFPGVMGSKLYDTNGELWVSRTDTTQAKLLLDANGNSVNDVFTKDDTQNINDEGETGMVDEVFGTNIYNSFINSLRDWKNDGTVSDYAFIPYDWRLSLDEVVTNGASTTSGNLSYANAQNFSESYILKKLEELQKVSESGKVTLIGHSNGGLVIKALVQKLKNTNNPLYDKIDKIIFVAVPQVGTPDAVVSLLHGSSLGPFSFVMRSKTLRELAENMPTVYNLIPTDGYFSTIDPSISADKVVEFQNDSVFSSQINQYGVFVSNVTELKNYILGIDSRSKPTQSDTNSPNIGNTFLYSNADSVHTYLDSWQAPLNTTVIQVAGWGEETTSGIKYEKCYDHSVQGYHKCVKLRKVVDGDGVVVIPSALWMATSTSNVERWWVNLKKVNTIANSSVFREHRDLLEVKNLNDFIASKLKNENWLDAEDIVTNDSSALPIVGSYLHYTLHSPLSLGIYDNLGRYTGLDPSSGEIIDEIPSARYEVFGDTQFISIPENMAGQVRLKGITDGAFTLDIEKQFGNNVVESTSIGGVPSLAETVVVLDINPNIASTTLDIDKNGDGVFEKQIQTQGKEEIIYDDVAPEVYITFSTTTKSIVFEGVDENILSTTVSTSSVSVLDKQGNTTVLYFLKLKNEKDGSKIVLRKISRNGTEQLFLDTEIRFEMDTKKNGLVHEFKSEVKVRDSKVFSLKYDKEKNVTKIKDRTLENESGITKQGLVVEKIITNKDGVKFEY